MTQKQLNMSNDRKGASAPTDYDNSWLNIRYYRNGTIMKPEDLENELPHPPKHDEEILDRVHGSMVGMALGDAVGAHVEFRPQTYMEKNPVKSLKGGGTWGLKRGQFTDDTSMALCLANSLVVCRDFIPYDQLVRYKWWFRSGYMSSTGKCFDIGAATRDSLEEFERRQKPFQKTYGSPSKNIDYCNDPEFLEKFNVECSKSGVAGNGALMRLAPVPLFFYHYPEHAVEFSGISGRITHGDKIAYDACRYYGALIVAALRGEKKEKLLADNFYSEHEDWFDNKPLHPYIMAIAEGSYKRKEGGHSAGIRGKGYIVQSLEAALWAFCFDEDSFETGVLKAVNLGDDTDTTAAIYGQLAGAYYGYQGLPEEWRNVVYAKKFIRCLSTWIVYEGGRWQPEQPPALINSASVPQGQPTSNTKTINKQKQEINTKQHDVQTNSQSNIKTSSGKKSESEPAPKAATRMKTQSTEDENSKSKKGATQSKNINTASSSHRSSFTNGVLERESVSTKKVPSTNPSPKQPLISTAESTVPYSQTRLQSIDDILTFLHSLGEEYMIYAKNFKQNDVDGYGLLTDANEKRLTDYGITNPKHQQKILSCLRGMKGQLSRQTSTENN